MTITALLTAIIFGVACSIIGVTTIEIMSQERIINWWFRLGENIGKYYDNGIEYEKWFYRPLWGCSKCFSGQLALWAYFILHTKGNSPANWMLHGWFSFPDYSLFAHVLTIASAIISAVLFTHFIKKVINDN